MKKHCSKCMDGMMKKKDKKEDKKKDNKKKPGHGKFIKVMKEYKEDKLHSGSKKGPKVHNPKQALAIAFSEDRKANKKK